MANNINSRIYKNRICALKYANKVNGTCIKQYSNMNKTK